MCGICGIRTSAGEEPSREMLEAMAGAMAHRGPDGAGVRVLGRVGLGHRRLSIVDLAGGAQPMANEDGRVWTSFNGEIYNQAELRAELEARGHHFRTRCDTEVLVHGWEEWGADLPRRLRGMFAFAVYDREFDRLLLARDRLGIKPLYLRRDGDSLLFASEVRALLASGLVEAAPDVARIDAFVTLGYVPGKDTLFSGIEKLRPGHWLLADANGIREERYWHAEKAPVLELSDRAAEDALRALLADTVEKHLMSDVPLGVFLSGGVDSSAVAAILRRELGREVMTFSIGYSDDPRSNELPYASRVARDLGCDHHELVLTHEDFFSGIDALLDHAEEPLVESAAVALLQLARFARPHATVLLSGEGADEAFAGYDLYRTMRRLDRARVLAPLAPLLRAGGSEKRKKYADWLESGLEARYRGISSDVTASIRERMYAPEMEARLDGALDRSFAELFEQAGGLDPLARMQYVDLKTWLVDDLLLKADKMTMAASIELRVPFLDHHVVEFGLGLAPRQKVRGTTGKWLLKRTMERWLPREILHRKKQGFPTPVAKWLREDLHERTRAILLDPATLARGYFRREYLEECLEAHRSGREDRSRRLFTLLVLELWHRRYVR